MLQKMKDRKCESHKLIISTFFSLLKVRTQGGYFEEVIDEIANVIDYFEEVIDYIIILND